MNSSHQGDFGANCCHNSISSKLFRVTYELQFTPSNISRNEQLFWHTPNMLWPIALETHSWLSFI